MQIVFSCENCGREFRKDVSLAGKKGRCKDCGHVFLIPGPPQRVSSRQPQRASPPPPPRRVASSAPSAPEVHDPFGLYDVPVAVKRAVSAPETAEEDIPLPRQVRPGDYSSTKKKKSRRKTGGEFFDGLPGFIYLAIAGVFGLTYLLAVTEAIGPPTGGLVFLGAAVLSSLVLFVYGFIGILVVAFRSGVVNGFLCWFCPPYLLGYVYREWDEMKGVFLSYVASMGLIAFMGVVMPSLPGVNRGAHRGALNVEAEDPDPDMGDAALPDFPGHGFVPPAVNQPTPPRDVEPPALSNSITVIVAGGAPPAFGDQLTELIKKISPEGYSLSSTGSGARSTYSITFQKSISSQEFADQIVWAKVTRVSGQAIEIDGSVSRAR
jgi:hypothetical protein